MKRLLILLALLFRRQSTCRADAFSFLQSSLIRSKRLPSSSSDLAAASHRRTTTSLLDAHCNALFNATYRSEEDTVDCLYESERRTVAAASATQIILAASADTDASSSSSSSSPTAAAAAASSWQRPAVTRRGLDLMWCQEDYCKDAVRERVVGLNNQIYLNGPATGQVAYHWTGARSEASHEATGASSRTTTELTPAPPTVLILIRQGDETLLQKAADAVQQLTAQDTPVRILLDPSTAARLKHYHGVGDDHVCLFEVQPTPGFGSGLSQRSCGPSGSNRGGRHGTPAALANHDDDMGQLVPNTEFMPDLICTLGGDGLLMHASMIFQGPVPPILCVSGGSLGFLTPFRPDEMVDAIRVALGLVSQDEQCNMVRGETIGPSYRDMGDHVFPPNMPSYPYEPLEQSPAAANDNDSVSSQPSEAGPSKFSFGRGSRICLSIRMRLECTVMSREGTVRARYNVLNEVVVDRGSSPYLAALECFCDDVHLTTVQADGVIFATPTGSTAYSLAAGSSVVHPAVPCILVTPICPHVLSFRSMVFPDHVVLRCYVPDDARAVASVAFDGKHRQELARGDSVQIRMSRYPVPTINRDDHSSDWLSSLKRNFNFNSRARQQPL